MSNLILTPHVAAGGVKAEGRGRVQDYGNIMAVLHGQPLQHQVA